MPEIDTEREALEQARRGAGPGMEGRRPWRGVAQTKRWRGSEEEVEGCRRSLCLENPMDGGAW